MIPRSSSAGSPNCRISSFGTWGKGFLPACENNNQCVNGFHSKLSCYNLWDPYCGLSLTGVRRAVITADLESTQHHSSCDQTTEGKWVQATGAMTLINMRSRISKHTLKRACSRTWSACTVHASLWVNMLIHTYSNHLNHRHTQNTKITLQQYKHIFSLTRALVVSSHALFAQDLRYSSLAFMPLYNGGEWSSLMVFTLWVKPPLKIWPF